MKSYHICLTRKVSCKYIIICGLVSFSELMDDCSLCLIIKKWYWINLTIFCWCLTCYSCFSSLHIPYYFSFTVLFWLAWIELVDVRKEPFHSREYFHLSLRRRRCFKSDEKSKFFCCFLKGNYLCFVLYESDGFTSNYIVHFLISFLINHVINDCIIKDVMKCLISTIMYKKKANLNL